MRDFVELNFQPGGGQEPDMSSLEKKEWELERAYYELEFLGRDCGGLSWLT
jgi:hypothetical protein